MGLLSSVPVERDWGDALCVVDSAVPRRVEAFTGDAVLSMACGQYHTCVSIERVGVYSWGKNDYGQVRACVFVEDHAPGTDVCRIPAVGSELD
jgi:alpha-tubulin suppressor-like RCC1 family protein